MVAIDGFDLQDIVAVECCWVDVFVEFLGVGRGVVKVADGEGDGVGSCWPEAVSSFHEVLGENHLGAYVEVEAYALGSAARGMVSPFASLPNSVVIGGAVIVVSHFFVSLVVIFRRFDWVCLWVVSAIRFVMMFVVRLVYILFVVLCKTVGVWHRSRVVWRRGAVDVRGEVLTAVNRNVGWGRGSFEWYVCIYNRSIFL
jgi:hypothetical protein